MTDLNPFLLAANTPQPDPRLLPLLRSNPSLAAEQDRHGYSLLHAAASYNHIDLLRVLVKEFGVDINLRDEDDETCLFVAETVDAAKCIVEELHVDVAAQNNDGMTAREKIESEDEYPEVLAYLAQDVAASGEIAGADSLRDGRLPPLPPNVRLNLSTATNQDEVDINAQEPDPEFRRRIEELASQENFHTEEGQQQLRELITDAVRDVGPDGNDSQRRKLG